MPRQLSSHVSIKAFAGCMHMDVEHLVTDLFSVLALLFNMAIPPKSLICKHAMDVQA